MTTPITYAEYEAARQAGAMLRGEPSHWGNDSTWRVILMAMGSGSSGSAAFISGYGPTLPRVGSSSFIVDRRPVQHVLTRGVPEASAGLRSVWALPVVEQLEELLATLSLNKTELARILGVSRPTMYDWFHGKEPNAANMERLQTLLRILTKASVSSTAPLNARFVRHPLAPDTPSLIDLLGEESIDEEGVARVVEQARALAGSASRRRTAREARLCDLGFEDPSREQRKEQLATNVALKDWPKR